MWCETLLYIRLIFVLWVDNVKLDLLIFLDSHLFLIYLGNYHSFSAFLSMDDIAKHHCACAVIDVGYQESITTIA